MHDENILVFDGTSLETFSTFITDAGIYESPEPQYDKVEIEGRNGDLIIEKNRYNNIVVTYPTIIYEDFDENYMRLRSFLLSRQGYKRIEDSFVPDRFRLGRFTSDLNPKYPYRRGIGSFEISFYCKPQWFMKQGEQTTTMTTSSMTIYNPTNHNSNPLYRVYGSGYFVVNGNRVTVASGATSYIDIDCEIMDSYEGTANRNSLITRAKGWPVLQPGVNTITKSGITKIEIIPRWFVL